MCDRDVKSEYILIKLCALVSEYICERTTKFHEKILFDSGVINHSLRGSAALLWRRRQFPMGKMEILTPCKIETLEQIGIQFVRIDYFHERSVCSKFGENPFTGDLWAEGWNITFYVTFFSFFFSDQRREETPGRILTRNGSKDAKSRKDVPFGGYRMKNWNLIHCFAPNRQFPAKMMKNETPSISESTKPIEMKI